MYVSAFYCFSHGLLVDSEQFHPEKLIQLLEKRQQNSPAVQELSGTFDKLLGIASKYHTCIAISEVALT